MPAPGSDPRGGGQCHEPLAGPETLRAFDLRAVNGIAQKLAAGEVPAAFEPTWVEHGSEGYFDFGGTPDRRRFQRFLLR